MKSKKSQVALEYILITVFAISLMLSLIYFTQRFMASNDDSMNNAFLYKAASQIIYEAKSIYTVGPPSWSTLEVTIPNNFIEAVIYNNEELVLSYRVSGGSSSVVVFSNIPLYTDNCTGNACYLSLHPGKNRLKIKSEGDYVNITPS